MAFSAGKGDNLLGEMYIFANLGVLFCVTQNSFNFTREKRKGGRKEIFEEVFNALTSSFLKTDEVIASGRVAQKKPHCNVSIVIFMVSG